MFIKYYKTVNRTEKKTINPIGLALRQSNVFEEYLNSKY